MPGKIKKGIDEEGTPGSAVAQLARPGSKKLKRRSHESTITPFTAVDAGSRVVKVVIILEGPGNEQDKHWYSAQAVQDGVQKFAGARAFLNHQTLDESEERPEQDVTLLAGFYSNLSVGTAPNPKLGGRNVAALMADFNAVENAAGDTAFGLARAEMLWKEAYSNKQGECLAAISINSGGWSDGTVEYNGEEWTNVVAFEDVRSADIVTRPGAGGAFVRLAESLSGVPGTNQESAMKKKLLQLAVALETANSAARAAKNAEAKKPLVEAATKARQAFNAALEAERKETEKREAAGEEAEPETEEGDEAPDPAAHMAALKAHVPQGETENDQQYSDRLDAITKHASAAGAAAEPDGDEAEGEEEAEGESFGAEPGKKPPMQQSAGGVKGLARHRESAIVSKFRKEQPRLYAEVMTTMRETVGAERHDFKAVKVRLSALESENRDLRLERDLGICTAMLTEANIPAGVMKPGELLKLDEADRKTTINRMRMLMEGGTRVFNGGGNGGGAEGGFDLSGI